MRTFRAFFAVFTLALLGAAFVASAQAQGLHETFKKTSVTITRPMEIPGQVLQPGTYVFKVMDVIGFRNIMQVTNADETKVFATVIAVPDYRVEQTDQPVVQYKEEAAGKPSALRAWFYAHEKSGLEFVYPKTRAVELAQASNEVVPAETVEPTESNLKTVPLIAETPQGKEEPVAEAIETTPAPAQVAQALPKTASPVPLIALLGGILVMAGFGLKRIANQRS